MVSQFRITDYVNNYFKDCVVFGGVEKTVQQDGKVLTSVKKKWRDIQSNDFNINDRHIGVKLGEEYNLICLDIDVKPNIDNGIEQFQEVFGFDYTDLNTLTFKSPSGGVHMFFKYDQRLKKPIIKLGGMSIDLLTNGGCAFQGELYPVEKDCPIIEMNEEMVDKIMDMTNIKENGQIEAQNEKTFGMMSWVDKELLMCLEVQQRFSNNLASEKFLKMVAGESLLVPVKGKQPEEIDEWKSNIITCGNEWLDYSEEQHMRRIVPFHFTKRSHKKDVNLDKKIQLEAPGILLKALRVYWDINEHIKTSGQDFWTFCPQYFRSLRSSIFEQVNVVQKFLDDAGEEYKGRRYYCSYEEGAQTSWDRFKNSLNQYIKVKFPNQRIDLYLDKDNEVLQKNDFKVRYQHICKSCQNKAVKGCCSKYNEKNRAKRLVIENMKLVVQETDYCSL